jgi:hypothetical protein
MGGVQFLMKKQNWHNGFEETKTRKSDVTARGKPVEVEPGTLSIHFTGAQARPANFQDDASEFICRKQWLWLNNQRRIIVGSGTGRVSLHATFRTETIVNLCANTVPLKTKTFRNKWAEKKGIKIMTNSSVENWYFYLGVKTFGENSKRRRSSGSRDLTCGSKPYINVD